MILWLFFVFFEVAIAVGAFGVMGSFGTQFSEVNFRVFGILALLYPIALIVISYRFYRCKKISLREVEIAVASMLLFLLLLILQFVFFSKGVIGEAIVEVLKPYLGNFGISTLALLGLFMCVITIRDEDVLAWIKSIDMVRIGKVFKLFFQKLQYGIVSKIIHPLVQGFKQIYKRLRTPAEKFPTPPIELDFLQEELPKPQKNSENFIEAQVEEIVMDDLKDLPVYRQENKEEMMFDDDIEIQEYIVAHNDEKKCSNIKVLDKSPPPPKENPFSYDELIRHRSSSISSSVELREKIREKNLKKVVSQEIKETKTSKPSITSKITPKPLQNNPLASLIHSQTPIKDCRDMQDSHLIEVKEEELQWEKELREHVQIEGQGDQAGIDESGIQEQNEPMIQEDKNSSLKQEMDVGDPVELENEEILEVCGAPKQYTSAFEITPTRTKSIHAKVSTLAENEALLQSIDKGKLEIPKDYKLPPISLLSEVPHQEHSPIDEGEIDEKIESLLEKLSVFKIEGDVERTYSGPIITTLEFRPAPNVKVSRIQSLENDIAMALEARSIRIQAPIPGKSVVGIEIPNRTIQTIYLREIFESEIFKNSASPLTLALGKDVVGNPFVTDLKKLPHLLIAGTTGSGKSVGVNAMILSLLYRNSPEDLKLMMVDPKMVEFMPYTDLPHLITPIITDPKKAVIGLGNAVKEMERRYTLMSQSRTKEIVSYNQKAEELGLEKFPYFVIIIDELADLMMTAGKEVEYSMARIAQMGRASGMHLIVATQSPRAEVLTGLIKTNLPAHLSYKVGTKIDAGIIGCAGAETLLGRGDLLFTPPGVSGLVRLHAPWSSENEVNEIVSYIKEQREVVYDPFFSPEERESFGALDAGELDSESARLVEEAKKIILQDGKTSISYIQRRLGIGYNKAADIVEKLEQIGFLSAPNSKGAREILG